jgi:hypothetical protein
LYFFFDLKARNSCTQQEDSASDTSTWDCIYARPELQQESLIGMTATGKVNIEHEHMRKQD